MVDRFADGDPNNDLNVEPSVPGKFHGGDWQGVIDHLDYLKELGVTALWISPVVKNVEDDAGFDSYHGYWTQDFLRPNAHFGDLEKLRELVDAAHAKGMLVILDVVTNHMGQLFYYDINGNGQPDDTISGGGLSHTCLQICAQQPAAVLGRRADVLRAGQGLPRADHRVGSRLRSARRPGLDLARLLGPRRRAVHRTGPTQNRTPPPRPPDWFDWPDDKPWFDDPSWYHRKRPRLRVVARGRLLDGLRARAGDRPATSRAA